MDIDSSSIFDDAEFEGTTVSRDVTDESSVLSSSSTQAPSIPKDYSFHDRVELPKFDGSNSSDDEASFFHTLAWDGLTYESFLFPTYIKMNGRNRLLASKFHRMFLAQELNHLSTVDKHNDSDSELSPVRDETSSSLPDRENVGTKNTLNHSKTAASQREILVMEWSRDGRYLATAGRDQVIKIWKVVSSPLAKLENERKVAESMNTRGESKEKVFENAPVFHQYPVMEFRGHTQTILSLDWSKNNFLLSGGMDRTARLWHVERPECLQIFKHSDFVTTVNFHPNDDRFFLSGSLDNCVRLWSILESNVAFSKDLGDDILITATCFTPDGEHCMVGSLNGMLTVLETKGLYLVTKFHIKKRSVAHPFNRSNDNKVTGIKVFENKNFNHLNNDNSLFSQWNVLITTNDSKIRLVDSHLKKLVTRFKGLSNSSSSIEASMTEDQKYIIAGSEDHWCYIWENNNSIINNKLRSAMKELLHDGVTQMYEWEQKHKKYTHLLHDNKLMKKLNIHKTEDETSDYVSNENSSYISFHAHHSNVNVAKFAPESTKALLEMSDDIIFDLVKRGKNCGITTLLPKSKHKEATAGDDESSVPDLGKIIVTADEYGLIRVFRQDNAYATRKQLVERYRRAVSSGSSNFCDKQPGCTKQSKKDQSSKLKRKMLKHRPLSPGREGVPSIKDILGRGNRNSIPGETSQRSSSMSKMLSARPSLPISSEFKTPVNRGHLNSVSEDPVFIFNGVDVSLKPEHAAPVGEPGKAAR